MSAQQKAHPSVPQPADAAKPVRLAGTDRYETSLAVVNALYGTKLPSLCIATGSGFPDALTGAALAGQDGGAILLVDGSGTTITDGEIAEAEKVSDVKQIRILGGVNAVSDEVKTSFDSLFD